jgi:hypothetical protein
MPEDEGGFVRKIRRDLVQFAKQTDAHSAGL